MWLISCGNEMRHNVKMVGQHLPAERPNIFAAFISFFKHWLSKQVSAEELIFATAIFSRTGARELPLNFSKARELYVNYFILQFLSRFYD